MKNPFFKKKKSIKFNDILSSLNLKKQKINYDLEDIKEINTASKNDITFFHSIKYLDALKKTKSRFIITNKKYLSLIPKKINTIEVLNVLLTVSKVTSLFYPKALDDNFDEEVSYIDKKKFQKLKIGKNILLGKNVKIGTNCSIGHNTIIEKNVRIGNNCKIGCNVILKNTIIGNNTNILDGAVIGKKGFGFYPGKEMNVRYPHIGLVLIGDNVEIGCNNTIDRGSLSNTVMVMEHF